jgi:hypothetical protein
MSDQAKELLSMVDADRLMKTTAEIARWERLSGSEDEQKAFDFIDSQLRSMGYACQQFHPTCLVSLPGPASLQIVGQDEEIPCITHSHAASTPEGGIEVDLVDVQSGTPAEYSRAKPGGKAVLVDGLATPTKVAPAESFRVAAVIHNSGPQIHDMTISPVWGNPTPSTMQMLPTIPHISVDEDSARRLRDAIASGGCKVRVHASVETAWKPLPVLIADSPGVDQFSMHVLLSGHVDSWYYGAMDNGSANAAMLETARILSDQFDQLRHGLRIAFWSGHSHARYATSAWYADDYWSFTHHYCLAHVNIDSPGGIGATDLTAASTMAESYPMAREIFRDVAGAELQYDRIGRLGDQSFWGAGIPSFYCSISQQPPEEKPTGIGALLGRGGGLGWWWHTPDDTIDKLDPENLRRDTQILLATVHRLCTERKLSYDQTPVAREIRETLETLQSEAGEDLDLSSTIELARNLESAATDLFNLSLNDSSSDDEFALHNGCITGVSRILIPVNYTISGEYEHDLAVPGSPLPALQPMRQLPARRQSPNAYYPWVTKLRRERNRVEQALIEATSLIQQTLAVFNMQDDD